MTNSKPYPSKTPTTTSTATATNSSTPNAITVAPDDHDGGGVEAGRPSSVASAAPPRRDVQSNIDGYQRKRAGEAKSTTKEPASVVLPGAPPRRERGLQGIRVRPRPMPHQGESESLALRRVQEKLHLIRHLRVRFRPIPQQRVSEVSDSLESTASSPQAQRMMRNLMKTTRNLRPFERPRLWMRL
jgi:hypothetical protein